MKRFLILFISVLIFSTSLPAVFAQKAPTPFKLHQVYETPINDFLKAIKKESAEKAYILTGPEFQKFTTLPNFENLVELSQVKNTVSKQWIGRETEGKQIVVSGNFTYDDGKVITMVFVLGFYGKIWKVDGWRISLTPEMVASSFPQGKNLKLFLASELKNFESSLKNRKSQITFFRKMSQVAQRTIPIKVFLKALTDYRKQNRNISFKTPEEIQVTQGFPALQGTQMIVDGSYANDTHSVTFNFIYDFESGWKLNSFNVVARTPEEIQEAEEKAKKEAEEKAALKQKKKEERAAKRAERLAKKNKMKKPEESLKEEMKISPTLEPEKSEQLEAQPVQ